MKRMPTGNCKNCGAANPAIRRCVLLGNPGLRVTPFWQRSEELVGVCEAICPHGLLASNEATRHESAVHYGDGSAHVISLPSLHRGRGSCTEEPDTEGSRKLVLLHRCSLSRLKQGVPTRHQSGTVGKRLPPGATPCGNPQAPALPQSRNLQAASAHRTARRTAFIEVPLSRVSRAALCIMPGAALGR